MKDSQLKLRMGWRVRLPLFMTGAMLAFLLVMNLVPRALNEGFSSHTTGSRGWALGWPFPAFESIEHGTGAPLDPSNFIDVAPRTGPLIPLFLAIDVGLVVVAVAATAIVSFLLGWAADACAKRSRLSSATGGLDNSRA